MSLFHIKEHTLPASHIREYARATSQSQDDELLQHVKEYIPKDNPHPKKGDVTIIGAHANGFPKELYEPLWDELHHHLTTHGIRIRSILIADAAWQGQSGLLNQSKLGNDPSWHDYHRDISHLLNLLRPPAPLVGLGHSFGAVTMANLSLSHPRLLTTLVLIDPAAASHAITPAETEPHTPSLAAMSIRRRDEWPSRADAAAAFARSPFFRSWDPRVLQAYIHHGLCPISPSSSSSSSSDQSSDVPVRLLTTRHQEVFTFLRPSWPAYDAHGTTLLNPDAAPDLEHHTSGDMTYTWPFYRPEPTALIPRLVHLRPPTLYIFGGRSDLSQKEQREEKMRLTGTGVGGSGGRERGRVREFVAEQNGHLVPMEDPGLCAREAAGWIAQGVERWRAEEKVYEEWVRSKVDKATISDEFKDWNARSLEYIARHKVDREKL